MKYLVTGGAGYIGSVTVKRLIEAGHEVVVLDNLINGHRESVTCKLVEADLTDKTGLFESLKDESFDGVIHFAANALAGESMQEPYKYFNANTLGGLNLLELMREKNVKHIIFSSTCAVYGTPDNVPVTEQESKKPESVYGESKLMFENILKWYDVIYGIKHINLRYFNACGAALDGTLGEQHDPETHIIPVAMKALLDERPFSIFGTDYPTADGTCIRDYIHIEDLAIAHIKALEYVRTHEKSDSFNISSGRGYSNRQITDMIQKISGKTLQVEEKDRRPGDPAEIYGDNRKARELLGFDPKYSDLETIISSAWKWHNR